MALSGDLLTLDSHKFKVVHHLNQGTTQHSVIAVEDEHVEFVTEVLREGGDLSKFFSLRDLKGFDEFRPYFLCQGIFKKNQMVGVWDLPVICFNQDLLTRAAFEQSDYGRICTQALREAKTLTLRIRSNQLDARKPEEFFDQVQEDEEGAYMILDKPLEGVHAAVLDDMDEFDLSDELKAQASAHAQPHAHTASTPEEWQPDSGDGSLNLKTEKIVDLDL